MSDPISAAVGVGGSLLSGAIGAKAAKSAANTQADAAYAAQELQKQQFDLVNQQQAPGRAMGYGAFNRIGSMLEGTTPTYDTEGNPIGTQTGTGYLTHQFNADDLNANLAPNYEFMKNQGLGAVGQSLNVGGGGSNVTRGGIKFAEDYAGNAYQSAFDNYLKQKTGIYNTLAGIAGLGQVAQGATNTAGQNYATNAGNLGVGAATASAGGTVGAANALTGGIGNAANSYYLSNLLSPSSSSGINYNPITSIGSGTPGVTFGASQIPAWNGIGGSWATSDRRLKTNIEHIGMYKNGLKKYTWDYIWGEKGTGAMADEVEKLIPEAVKVLFGYKHVNYALLGD